LLEVKTAMARILIVNNAELGIKEFAEPIIEIVVQSGSQYHFIEYEECLSCNFNDFDGIILTGSPQGNDIVEHHLPYFKWIKKIKQPVLGICAGHHVVGYLYGSEILRSIEPESGDHEVDIIKNDPIFYGMATTIKVMQMHNDSVTLPDSFELLATAKTCKNQMMKHKFKSIYTTQFHPEFYNHDLIQNFVAMCDASAV
jgi:GMP synthase (glutamine-hydrolysing)